VHQVRRIIDIRLSHILRDQFFCLRFKKIKKKTTKGKKLKKRKKNARRVCVGPLGRGRRLRRGP
jgi:hypothetical protein